LRSASATADRILLHPFPPMPPDAAPRFSVLVPTRNTRELTLACLEALRCTDPPPHEVLLVDDGSGDGTSEAVALRYPEVRVIRQASPVGFSTAVNRAAAAAGGDLLVLLNSDTEVPADTFWLLARAFARDPRLGVAGAALYYPDGSAQWSGGPVPGRAWLLSLASGVPALLARLPGYRVLRPVEGGRRRRVEWVTGAAMAIPRRTWEEVGPLDERFAFYCQDLDFCLRARDRGWGVALIDDWRVVHHHGATIARPGAHQQLRLLFLDLVRLAAKHHGPRGGRRAARALRLGGGLQRLARRARLPLAPPEKRRRLRRELRELEDALAALPSAPAAVAPTRDS
jgi:N-acetylglucosaminyl-diphospho-decaprenol L-rhamnosyltransferase